MAVRLEPVAPEDALASLRARGANLQPSFAWQDTWQEAHALAGTVAKSTGFDILKDLFDGLDRALAEGRTLQDFARDVRPTLVRKGWWGRAVMVNPATGLPERVQLGSLRRLRTIFDTNLRVSYAAGHWASFERNKAERPWLRYVAILDGRTRPEHAAQHDVTLPVGHRHWNVWAPPNGWNCRCALTSLSDEELEELGIRPTETPPAPPDRPWLNRRTGLVDQVPEGIDPGWAYNPGRANARAAINSAFAQKAAGAPVELVDALVRERVASEDFTRFLADPQGEMPVMAILPAVAEAIGTRATAGLLSTETLEKQRRHHPELTDDDYRRLPSIGTEPTVVVQTRAGTAILIQEGGRFRLAVIKGTRRGEAAYLVSYRYTDAEDLRLLKRQGRVIYGAWPE